MTDCVTIYWANYPKIELDGSNFGQERCKPLSVEAKAEMLALAERIVKALNKP